MMGSDFIKLDFDAFVKDTEILVDTTSEETAKKHDAFNERAKYGPISVVIGSGALVKGLDRSLMEAEVGKEMTVEVLPAEAFGERDPKQIEVFPLNKIMSLPEFRKGDRYPSEGMEIRINNRVGTINRIFAGRVRVDFNNRWSGRTIVYKYKVLEVISEKEGKLKAILEGAYPSSGEFRTEFRSDSELDITLPDIAKLDTSWAMAKFKLISDLRNHLGIKVVRLIEEYVRKDESEHDHDHEGHDHEHGHEHEHPAEAPEAPATEKAPEEAPEIPKEAAPKPRGRPRKKPAEAQ
ncbi:MAG: peptidylprolyl isomerase [Candidatus Thermoplasmatota archaeon]|jgi:FKBP-type peptidyl-prolyl cis-trans isomerase 2|nr:peptidylprolyl isomerase [Candidatus Thermoplasmatota archaeon]